MSLIVGYDMMVKIQSISKAYLAKYNTVIQSFYVKYGDSRIQTVFVLGNKIHSSLEYPVYLIQRRIAPFRYIERILLGYCRKKTIVDAIMGGYGKVYKRTVGELSGRTYTPNLDFPLDKSNHIITINVAFERTLYPIIFTKYKDVVFMYQVRVPYKPSTGTSKIYLGTGKRVVSAVELFSSVVLEPLHLLDKVIFNRERTRRVERLERSHTRAYRSLTTTNPEIIYGRDVLEDTDGNGSTGIIEDEIL